MATFTNQATLTYNGGTVNSNIVTGELVQVLTASKTAAAESYRTGDLSVEALDGVSYMTLM